MCVTGLSPRARRRDACGTPIELDVVHATRLAPSLACRHLRDTPRDTADFRAYPVRRWLSYTARSASSPSQQPEEPYELVERV